MVLSVVSIFLNITRIGC